MKCGLLGRRLGHSYSPQIHKLLGSYSYDLFETEPDALESFVKYGDYTGINVTIPYKKDVIPFLDELSPVARKMGSVNTIIRRSDGTLFGHNTDYFGFASMVKRSGLCVAGKKVLVLGSGGTSNTAVKVLEDLGALVVIISRSGENHYGNLHLHRDAAVIVNTTPVGMYPNNGNAPLDLFAFPNLEGVLDVIYNPSKTQLLIQAEKLGLPHENGLWMLVAQAKEASEYFGGTPIPDSVIEKVYRKMSATMQNILLIGMPGCGKSTIASLLSQKTGRIAVDADAEIVNLAGKSIPDIFREEGEEAFRKLETQVLKELGKQSQLIIATGGGCVTRPENYPLLHQNSIIFLLNRSLERLPREGRPLSQGADLQEMFAVRQPLYEAFADHAVDNNGTCVETVNQILALLEDIE